MEQQLAGGEGGVGGAIGGGSKIERLPKDFLAQVISLTSPGEASRLAAVSAAVRSAADSDAVWERFLPSDWQSIVARAVDPVEFATRKELYPRLSDQPILLDGGTMGDGWMELELGEFYNDNGKDGEVTMSLTEKHFLHWKRGLIIQGMEIRPKN